MYSFVYGKGPGFVWGNSDVAEMVLIDGCEDVRRGGGIVLSAKRMMNRVQK